MFSAEFERIAREHAGLAPHLSPVQAGLEEAGRDPVLVPGAFASAISLPDHIVEAVFDLLVAFGVLRIQERVICSSCDALRDDHAVSAACHQCGSKIWKRARSFRFVRVAPPKPFRDQRGERLASRARIALVTALPEEAAAVQALLIDPVQLARGQAAVQRVYDAGEGSALGSERHSLIHVNLPAMGNNPAAARASVVFEDFPTVRYLIMCGIAGGTPNPARPEDHVRLGDVVVVNGSGVVQYDFVKRERGRVRVRHPPRPPAAEVLEGARRLQASALRGNQPWLVHLGRVLRTLGIERPADALDVLTDPRSPSRIVPHPADVARVAGDPRVFHGVVGAANELLKDPVKRDRLRDEFGVRAIEMEGSGVAEAAWQQQAGYFVVRGICDYCNGDKNDVWHGYAAAVAAAYTWALLGELPADRTQSRGRGCV